MKGRRVSYALVGAMILFAAIPYAIINHLTSLRDWAAFDPSTQYDLDLFFWAWMIIPYLTLYLYYPAAAWLGSKNEIMWRQNIIFHQMMLISCWIVFLIFILLPVEIDLRHLVVDTEGTVWEPFFAMMHAVDTPWNSWPSLHIVQSMQVVLVLRYWFPADSNRAKILHSLLLIAWLLLVASTMIVKQHYIWDVATAIVFAGLGWGYWMKPCLEKLKLEETQDEFDRMIATGTSPSEMK
ncbi:MAG: phosphatase PAP2 family protein [Candidatus Poseidoniaceae archaeon]